MEKLITCRFTDFILNEGLFKKKNQNTKAEEYPESKGSDLAKFIIEFIESLDNPFYMSMFHRMLETNIVNSL